MIYLISTITLILILVTKIFFVFYAKGFYPSLYEILSISILVAILFFGSVNYIRNFKLKNSKVIESKGKYKAFLIAAIAIVLAGSFFINYSNKTLLWDAVALYDARAQFLLGGTNFSHMVDLSKFDPINSYYYALYPPYTSIIHFFWYKIGTPLNIGFFYSTLLGLFAISIFTFIKKTLGYIPALFLSLLCITNNEIFFSSLTKYTNLPFTFQFILGIFLLAEYLEDKSLWKFLMGGALIVTSQWIRYLEPLWIGVLLAFLITELNNKWTLRNMIPTIVLGIYGIIEYVAWGTFVSSFGESMRILKFGQINFIEPVVGIFTGSLLSIFIFFVKSWGLILLTYFFAICLAFLNKRKLSFLQIFLLLTILIYFGGLYFVSFQSVWWTSLGGSLMRGSTFMVPVSGYIILKYLYGKKN